MKAQHMNMNQYSTGICLLLSLAAAQQVAAAADLQLLRSCLSDISSTAPGAAQLAVFPDDTVHYPHARSVFNGRFTPSPAAVFFAYSTADVSAAAACGAAAGVKLSPSAGRQSFEGAALQDSYLTIDLSNMTQRKVSTDKKVITVGGGCPGGLVQSALHDSGIVGAAVSTPTCSWVGVGGYLSGGGMSILGRYLGLACDQVVGLQMVLANGTVVVANKTTNSDLLWASCGGGGGTFGIVTSFDLKISRLPNRGKVAYIQLHYAPGVNTTVAAFLNFQRWVNSTMDRKFCMDGIQLGSGLAGAQLFLSGVYLGPLSQALSALKAANMLNNLDPASQMTPATSDVAKDYPFGLRMQQKSSMYDVYFEEARSFTRTDYYSYPTPWATKGWTGSADQVAFLTNLMRGQGAQVVGGEQYNYAWWYSEARIVGLLTETGIRSLATGIQSNYEECVASRITKLEVCAFATVGHVLGGAYAAKRSSATAFPHRNKAFVLSGFVAVPQMYKPFVNEATYANAVKVVESYHSAMKPSLSEPETAYVNYMVPSGSLANWQQAYFGSNYKRLQTIKAKYDPGNAFGKPYTVQAAS